MLTLDFFITRFDRALRTLAAPAQAHRASPAHALSDTELTPEQKKHIARLMRINHTGEVCAQALYQGQALTARVAANREALVSAAREEEDHLAWCEERIQELGGRTSFLNPLWYAGSLALGVVAGIAGDKWNLAFLKETERQVESHLAAHLESVPESDQRTRAIVSQMKTDEAGHADLAQSLGAAEFPQAIKTAMRFSAKVMTQTVYWV